MEHSVDSSQKPQRGLACARHWVRVLRVFVLAAFICASAVARPALAQDAVHVVARGEQLGFIARRYGISLADLIAYNGISNPSLIYVGQRLLIPSGSSGSAQEAEPTASPASPVGAASDSYVVQRGDTLSEIAQTHGLSIAQLMELNDLTRSNFVWVGQQLLVSPRLLRAPQTAAPEAGQPALTGSTYVVRPGDTLSHIAQSLGVTTEALQAANALPNAGHVRVGQRLRIPQGGESAARSAPADGKRRIEINLTDQTLTAWQGDVVVMFTSISSGKSGTPTVTGSYRIGAKYESQTMMGEDYYLPDVPWVMYFHGSYAIHGTYWHNAFGVPTSHGCINMRIGEAQALYEWALPGTEVVVR